MLRKKEKWHFHKFNWVKAFFSCTVFSMSKSLNLSLTLTLFCLGFWLDAQWLRRRGVKNTPNRYSTSSGSWGELLGNYLKLLDHKLPDYELTHMVKIGSNIFMITLLFCLRQHFSVMTSLIFIENLSTEVLS